MTEIQRPGGTCGCGAAKIGSDYPHQDYCPAKISPGQYFRWYYERGVDGTFALVEALAPQLIEHRGEGREPVINIRKFWERYGPEVECSDESGLDWCFNMREGDHGHIQVITLGKVDYWVEIP